MADLTRRMPLTEGTNRVHEGLAAPSGLGAIADFATAALGSYEQFRANRSRVKAEEERARAKKEEAAIGYEVATTPARVSESAARQNAEIQAAAQVIPDLGQEIVNTAPAAPELGTTIDENGGVFVTKTEVPPAIEKDVSNAASRAVSIVTAVEQGSMPQITQEAALNAAFRNIVEKYPDRVDYIIDTYKKFGLDKYLFTELQDAADWREFDREEQQAAITERRKERDAMIMLGKEVHGAAALTMSEDQLELSGRTHRQAQINLETRGKELDISIKSANATEEDRERAQEDFNRAYENEMEVLTYNDATVFVDEVGKIVEALGKDPNNPDALNRFAQLGPRANMLASQAVNRILTEAGQHGYTGDREKLKARLTEKFKPLVDMFSSDSGVVKTHLDALKSIETAGKIKMAQALPIYTMLQKAGLNPNEMKPMMEAIQKDSKLSRALHDEINGFTKDWGADRASVRIMNIQRLLRGDARLNYTDPVEAAKDVKLLGPTVMGLAKGYVEGKEGIEPEKILNGLGEIAVGVRALGPSGTALSTTHEATRIIASRGTRNALKKAYNDKNADQDYVASVMQASMGASAHLLNNYQIQGPKMNDMFMKEGWKIRWDTKSGKYFAQRVPITTHTGGRSGKPTTGMFGSTTPPRAVSSWVEQANMNIENVIDLGAFTGTAPKGTELELRNWYARGVPLKSENTPIDPNAELDKMFSKVETGITQALGKVSRPVEDTPDQAVDIRTGSTTVKNLKGTTITVPSFEALEQQFAGNANYETIKQEAQARGIPLEVATRLGFVESGGTYADNMKPNSAGAMGPVQVVPKWHNDRAMQMFGKKVKDLSPQQIIAVGMQYLKEMYDEHGNWADAASAYHSGGPLAKRGNADDGNLYTRDYAYLVSGLR